MRFDDRTNLVTGATSGIGAATVRRLLAEGANVVAGDNRKDDLDDAVADFNGRERIHVLEVDTTDRDQVAAYVEETVRCFAPSMIRTPMTESMSEDPENAKRIRAAHRIGREGQPEEVAATIAFFCLTTQTPSPVSGYLSTVTKPQALPRTE